MMITMITADATDITPALKYILMSLDCEVSKLLLNVVMTVVLRSTDVAVVVTLIILWSWQ